MTSRSRQGALALPSLEGAVYDVVDAPQPSSLTSLLDSRLLAGCGAAAARLGGHKLSRLGVTSAIRGEGRTSIAAALAVVMAVGHGRRTLLVDLDLEHQGCASRFGMPSGPGLGAVVSGRASLDRAIRHAGEGLSLIGAGDFTIGTGWFTSELARSGVLDEVQSDFDIVIADLPPVLNSTVGARLVELFGNPLLVVRAAATPARVVRDAVATLHEPPAVLLNGTYSKLPGWVSRMLNR